MFQFTTTTVVNSDKDLTTGKTLYKGESGVFSFLRVGNFKKENVLGIYKAVAYDAEFAKITFDLSKLTAPAEGDVFRLRLYMGLSLASQNSLFANDLQWKGKPLSVEFVWTTDASTTVTNLVKTINKYEMMVYGKKLLNVAGKTSFLTIEATDEYQRFRVASIEKLDKDAYHGMGEFDVVRSLEDLSVKSTNAEVTDQAEGRFAGKEGFGTYSFILHNLRIPTWARTRAFAPNQDETPIIGAKYNQYTIHYCVNRGVLGDNAVGDEVKSRTTHVFYVKSDLASAFETALQQLGTITTVSASGTPDPAVPTVTAGDGLQMSGNTISVKVDGDTLTASASGLKVTDGKFAPGE